ncbi:MAG: hypothetical protein R2795_22230, partial [Saprospiraceae bacterium]
FAKFVLTRPNYSNLSNIPEWNYRAWLEILHQGGYATDPNYTDKILGVIWRYKLYELVEG